MERRRFFANASSSILATARRVALRICEQCMGESTLDDALIEELASGLREHTRQYWLGS